MRTLHLIDGRGWPESGEARARAETALRACAALRRSAAAADQSACLLGPAALERAAAALDAPTADRLNGPITIPRFARGPFRRFILDRGPPDVVACWGLGAARLARAALGDVIPRVVCLPEAPSGLAAASTLLDSGPVVVFTRAAREAVVAAGAPEGAVVLAPPPVGSGDVSAMARDRARAGLGLEPGEVAIAHVGWGRRADAARFLFLLGLLDVAGAPVVGVVPARQRQLARALRFRRTRGRGSRVILTDAALGAALSSCDLAVYEGGGAGPSTLLPPSPGEGALPIAFALGAGVPVVAPAWATDGEVGSDAAGGACVAHSGAIPELARVLLPLVESAAARREAAAAAARHSASLRAGERFAETFGAACALVHARLRS